MSAERLRVFVSSDVVLGNHTISWPAKKAISVSPPIQTWIQGLQTVGVDYLELSKAPPNISKKEPTLIQEWLGISHHLREQGSFRYALKTVVPETLSEAVITTEPVAMLVPFNHRWCLCEPPAPDQRVQLSRFALLRRVRSHAVLESSRGYGRIVLYHSAAIALVMGLMEPRSLMEMEIVQTTHALAPETMTTLLQLMDSIHALTPVNEGQPIEDTQQHLSQWSFHDLLFHSRSRLGRYDGFLGCSTVPVSHLGQLPALPAPPEGTLIKLSKPAVKQKDGPFFNEVLEGRRSYRQHGSQPLLLWQVSEFLYRSARVRQIVGRGRDSEDTAVYTFSNRVYPSSGATYELDLFLAIFECEGLDPGFYYYDPLHHQLTLLCEKTDFVEQLRQDAQRSSTRLVQEDSIFPKVLIVYAPRFERIMSQYDRVAYALLLKNVGCLHQTMYLVAEAMGLAGCALSNGDADLFKQLHNVPYEFQSSVGEFALGTRPTVAPPPCDVGDGWWERTLYQESL